jgi:tRNA (guanosine-2'-O-)-methyltransferase
LLPFFLSMIEALIEHLEKFATGKRVNVFNEVVRYRTRYITVVLEDLFQSHNASAVLRTCECFGIQDVHIIENKNKFSVNSDITLGADKWLTVRKFSSDTNSLSDAITTLRENGYRIIATTPHGNETLIENFDLEAGKIALFFGTELGGLSDRIIQQADECLKIPMYGFTESFNISVTVAIILHSLTEKLRKSTISWNISKNEMNEIKLAWLKKSIKNSEMLEKQFLRLYGNDPNDSSHQ